MIKRKIVVINKLGLHARAAAKLVNEAAHFESEIMLLRDEVRADAKSIMTLMLLAAAHGTELQVEVDGADEQQAADAVERLFRSRFGEEE